VKRRLEGVKRLLRWAHRAGLIIEDITVSMRPVRFSRAAGPAGLATAEVQSLLRAAGESGHGNNHRNYALVQILLQAGLRVEELTLLCVGDVTARERVGVVCVRHAKGSKQREVPLNATARRAIRRYLESRGSVLPQEPLFCVAGGRAMSVRTVQHTITELARRAPIVRLAVSPHTLRHTFALTYMQKNPGRLAELSALLGHESLDATAIYLRPSLEELAATLERSPLNVDR
jgi:integrase/recombinase XerC